MMVQSQLEKLLFPNKVSEPAHEIMVFMTQATSEGSGEPAHLRSLPESSLFAHIKYGSR